MSKKQRAKGLQVTEVYIDEAVRLAFDELHSQRELRPVVDLPAPPAEHWPIALLGPPPEPMAMMVTRREREWVDEVRARAHRQPW